VSNRVHVHVHATDSITRAGLVAQLRQESAVQVVDLDEVDERTVAVAATDAVDDGALAGLRELNQRGCTHSILVTNSTDDSGLLAAIEVGVCALVHRAEATPARIAHLATRALLGEAALPGDMLARLLKQVSRLQHNVLVPRGLTVAGLSPRETQVLRLVADGLDTDEIATALSYSSRTVKNILHSVTTRFCLKNRSHAVAYALREGLI
jgi:DNA-binding NarL/FixJ family response regulator